MSTTLPTPGPTFPLGKTKARPEAVTFKLSNYLDTAKLPPLKARVGHPGLLPAGDLGMLGNDQYGDCVWAGAAHETIYLNLEARNHVEFSDTSVLSDYSAVTGFNPDDSSTDNGTDMKDAASYRRRYGVRDQTGIRHKVVAYLGIEPGNLDQMKYAIWLFGAVGIGIQFPASAMTQFNNGQPWDVVPGSPIRGGHYIPGVYADKTGFQVITWGKRIRVTNRFLVKYTDEAIAYVSYEALRNGATIDGFQKADLLADLRALAAS